MPPREEGQVTGPASLYKVPVRNGDEGVAEGATLNDFWRWMASDLVSNTARGVFAEFLVALALDVADGVREEWASYDVRTRDGVRVEVKTSAYLQYWAQEQMSAPDFDIAPKRAWDPATRQYSDEQKRWSDVYVFCLHHHQDKSSLEPLDLSQWTFFVLSRAALDSQVGDQKRLRLTRLRQLGAKEVPFDGIAKAVREAAPPPCDRRVS